MTTEIIQKIIYVAEDGTTFELEKDCINYEKDLKAYSQLRFYDIEYNPLYFKHFDTIIFDDVDVIVAETKAAQEFINSIAYNEGVRKPFIYPVDGKRVVRWNSDDYEWDSVESLIEQMETEFKELQDKLSRLKKIKEL